jgi:hypothetical protein
MKVKLHPCSVKLATIFPFDIRKGKKILLFSMRVELPYLLLANV